MRLLGHTLSGKQMQCTGFGMSIITNDSLCEHRGWIRDLGGCRLGPAWLHLCVSLYVESIHLLQDKSYGVFTNQAQVRPQKCVLFIASFQLLLQLSILSHQLVSGLMKKYKRTHFTKSVYPESISEAESSFIGFKSWCVYLFQILYAVDGTKTKKCLHTSTCTTYLVVGIMYQLLLQSQFSITVIILG